jgi:hypothetical protein
MTDGGVSDERLIRDLEKMRQVEVWERERERELSLLKERDNGGGDTVPVDVDPTSDVGEIWQGWEEQDVVNPSSSSSSSSVKRLTAQRALLACRELILTERHYHDLLLSLLAGDTHPPPPSSMQRYAAELVHASAGVLRAMEQQPSALGVARAFVDNGEEVERAYVRWCEVVGGWFVGESGSPKRKRSRSVIDFTATTTTTGLEGEEGAVVSTKTSSVSPLKRVGTWRRSMPTITSLGEAGVSIYGYGSGSLRRRGREKDKEKENLAGEVGKSSGIPPIMSSQGLAPRPSKVRRKPAVRDLAILPTQRVMRYVLLYRGAFSFQSV